MFMFAPGGVLVALAARAAEHDLAREDLTLLSAHATFCAPVPQGPVDVSTRVLRRSKSDVPPPDAGLDTLRFPEQLLPFVSSFTAHAQYEHRRAVGHAGWEPGWTAGAGRYCGWTRLLTPATRADGTVDPASHAFVGDAPAVPMIQALGAEVAMSLMVPTLNLELQVVQPSRSAWHCVQLFAHECVDGFVHVTAEIWDEDQRLVALCNQRGAARGWAP